MRFAQGTDVRGARNARGRPLRWGSHGHARARSRWGGEPVGGGLARVREKTEALHRLSARARDIVESSCKVACLHEHRTQTTSQQPQKNPRTPQKTIPERAPENLKNPRTTPEDLQCSLTWGASLCGSIGRFSFCWCCCWFWC